MTRLHFPGALLCALMLCLVASAATSAAPIIAAAGRWAAIRGPDHCEAASLSELPASATRAQGRASLSFDRVRHGELALKLSRPTRPGASVMLTIGPTPFLLVARGALAWSRGPAQEAALIDAMREGDAMRIEARSVSGGRFVDRYLLAGAPTAIDAAAACAVTLARG